MEFTINILSGKIEFVILLIAEKVFSLSLVYQEQRRKIKCQKLK